MQIEIYNLEKSTWTIDKASDQRMVYVPKDTVVEFMKKVSLISTLRLNLTRDPCLICSNWFASLSESHRFVQIEDESNQRIKKYAEYAARMKLKFADYEAQSEEYYRNMLDKFKDQARRTVDKKQRELTLLK